jgi:hypothetical protein
MKAAGWTFESLGLVYADEEENGEWNELSKVRFSTTDPLMARRFGFRTAYSEEEWIAMHKDEDEEEVA